MQQLLLWLGFVEVFGTIAVSQMCWSELHRRLRGCRVVFLGLFSRASVVPSPNQHRFTGPVI